MNDGKNCRNCGAPLNEYGDCEYCGTKSPRRYSSRIEMTASSITLYADDRAVLEETPPTGGSCMTDD